MSVRQERESRQSATALEWFPLRGRIIRPCPDAGKTDEGKKDATAIVAADAINEIEIRHRANLKDLPCGVNRQDSAGKLRK